MEIFKIFWNGQKIFQMNFFEHVVLKGHYHMLDAIPISLYVCMSGCLCKMWSTQGGRSHIGVRALRIHHWSFYKNFFFFENSNLWPTSRGGEVTWVTDWIFHLGHILVLKWPVTITEHFKTNMWPTPGYIGFKWPVTITEHFKTNMWPTPGHILVFMW